MPTNIALNGGWIGRSISGSDVNSIKEVIRINNAANVGDISSVWGRIKDWFCGTNKEGAKRELFKLMSPTSTLDEKIKAFENLKSMAGDGCKKNFIHVVSHEGNTSSNKLKINCTTGSEDSIFELTFTSKSYNNECSKVSEGLNKGLKEKSDDIYKQFLKDCSRAKYSLNGVEIEGMKLDEKFKDDSAKLICLSQTLFAEVQNFLLEENAMHLDVPGVSGKSKVQYDIIEKKEIGTISVKATLEKDISAAREDEEFHTYLTYIEANQAFVNSLKLEVDIEFEKKDNQDIVAIKNITQRTS